MKIHVYTSCSINYLPKARVLGRSLKRRVPNSKLTLLLNDHYDGLIDPSSEPFDEILTPEQLGYSKGWIFEHNVMELCTAVKGRFLYRAIKEGKSDLYVYLDPDCYVFNDLALVDEYLGGASIGLVPHILTPETTDIGIELTEISVAEHGTYNLGHLFVRPDENGLAFAKWWGERLDKYCFDDKDRGLFTDQRWVDMAPALFEGVKVLRVPNLDVASWNLAGRTITQKKKGDETSFDVDGYPLITYHFSGTGPTGTHVRVRNIFDSGNAATAEIERIYEKAINDNGQAIFENIEFGWGFFDDNSPVPAIARKIYRRHQDLQQAFPNPYEVSRSKLVFKEWLRRNRPGSVDGIMLTLQQRRQAFMALFDESYYLARYPDAKEMVDAGKYPKALHHYIALGSRLFYNPNRYFNSRFYFRHARYYHGYAFNSRSSDASGTILWHYLSHGITSGAEPMPFFNSAWYLKNNQDIYGAFALGDIDAPIVHFLDFGDGERRAPGPDFKPEQYVHRNSEAQSMISDGRAKGPVDAYLQLNPYLEYDY